MTAPAFRQVHFDVTQQHKHSWYNFVHLVDYFFMQNLELNRVTDFKGLLNLNEGFTKVAASIV